MIKAIFQELNQELGMMQTIGEKELNTSDAKEANAKAKSHIELLSEIRGTKVSYMLQQNSGILASL